jgi:hypothetical protein
LFPTTVNATLSKSKPLQTKKWICPFVVINLLWIKLWSLRFSRVEASFFASLQENNKELL